MPCSNGVSNGTESRKQANPTAITMSLLFVTLNVAMNLYMKWLFVPTGGDFALPWTMLAVQQLEAYAFLQPLVSYRTGQCGWGALTGGPDDAGEGGSRCSMRNNVPLQILTVTSLFCLNVGLNSLSLVRISITLNQTVRAFLPVGVLVLGTVLERRIYEFKFYVTTAMLVTGITITCWGSPDFEFFGFCLAMASVIAAALNTSLNGSIVNMSKFKKAGPDGIMMLIMFQSIPAFFIFTAIAVATERSQIQKMIEDPGPWGLPERFGLVSISSALAMMANLGRIGLLAATSALTETVAGNAKVAVLCVIDYYFFGTQLRPYNCIGIGITFLGFSIHSYLEYATPVKVASRRDDKKGKLDAVSRARLISAAENGLLADHLALDMRFATRPPRTQSDDSVRPRFWTDGSILQMDATSPFLEARLGPWWTQSSERLDSVSEHSFDHSFRQNSRKNMSGGRDRGMTWAHPAHDDTQGLIDGDGRSDFGHPHLAGVNSCADLAGILRSAADDAGDGAADEARRPPAASAPSFELGWL